MKKTNAEYELVTKVVGFTCDVCEESYDSTVDDAQMLEVQEMNTISFVGGYGSVFEDMGRFELDICQHCLKQRLGPFFRKIEPTQYPTQEELQAGKVVDAFDWSCDPLPINRA